MPRIGGMTHRRRFLTAVSLLAAGAALPAHAGPRDWLDMLTGNPSLRRKQLPVPVKVFDRAPRLPADPARRTRGHPVVLFTDYNCPDCRRLHDPLDAALAAAADIDLVVLPTPLITPTSREVAALALAAQRQRPFRVLHDALMHAKGMLDARAALAIAAGLGLDGVQLAADAQREEVGALLDAAVAHHKELKLRGVPVMGVGAHSFHVGRMIARDFSPLFEAARKTG